MALIDALRDTILDSIKGRRFGLDPDGYTVGQLGHVQPTETLTSVGSTGVTLLSYGHTYLSSTNASTWILPAPPKAGAMKTISSISTSTLDQTLKRASSAFDIMSSDGSTMTTLVFSGLGGTVTLLARSSTRWDVLARMSTGMTAINGTT